MFENMGSAEAELHRKGVSLSTNLQNKIDQLYKRWKQLQNQMLSRQTVLQDACSDMDGTSLSGLAGIIAHLVRGACLYVKMLLFRMYYIESYNSLFHF